MGDPYNHDISSESTTKWRQIKKHYSFLKKPNEALDFNRNYRNSKTIRQDTTSDSLE